MEENARKTAKKALTASHINKIYLGIVFSSMILLLTCVSLAAYTSHSHVRGVVATGENTVLFSSNYLQLWRESMDGKIEQSISVPHPEGSEEVPANTPVTFNVTVCSFAQENPNVTNDHQIEYEIIFDLSGVDSANSYSIRSSTQANNRTFTQAGDMWRCSFPATTEILGRVKIIIYTVTMPFGDLGKASFEVTARPNTATITATNNYYLAAILKPSLSGTVQATKVEGRFPDASASNTPYDFDAFNYELSINTGTSSVTLSWDNSKVEIDKFMEAKLIDGRINALSENGTTTSLEFTMDAAEQTNLRIPFYYVNKPATVDGNPWLASWNSTTGLGTVISIELTPEGNPGE